jgi:ABC-type transporter Mla MlaB component
MPTNVSRDEMSQPMRAAWLKIDDHSDDAVVVTATGGIAADRALDLWATVEEALERAAGRLVAVDLLGVTTFDTGSVDALIRLARAAIRRHVHVCVLMLPNTPLYQYVEHRQSVVALLVYPSLATALADLEGPSQAP